MPRIKRSNHASAPLDILNKRDFDCTNMSGRVISTHGLSHSDAGLLSGSDLAAFHTDASAIRYVVYSYATPIAWCTLSGRWHIVRQRFSVTTSKHQGRLYMLPREVEIERNNPAPCTCGRGPEYGHCPAFQFGEHGVPDLNGASS